MLLLQTLTSSRSREAWQVGCSLCKLYLLTGGVTQDLPSGKSGSLTYLPSEVFKNLAVPPSRSPHGRLWPRELSPLKTTSQNFNDGRVTREILKAFDGIRRRPKTGKAIQCTALERVLHASELHVMKILIQDALLTVRIGVAHVNPINTNIAAPQGVAWVLLCSFSIELGPWKS